jgi:hypothetical protein
MAEPVRARRLTDQEGRRLRHERGISFQRRERARLRSERQQRWGRPKPKAA